MPRGSKPGRYWNSIRISRFERVAKSTIAFKHDEDEKIASMQCARRDCQKDKMSALGLGCVKTWMSQGCTELFSLLASPDSSRQRYWFSNRRNRDGISTRKFCVGVFTQPGSNSDFGASDREVRFTSHNGLKSDITACPFRASNGHRSLLDHLVGPRKQRRRKFEAERLGGFEIYNQFKLGGLFERQVRRPCAAQNASHEIAHARADRG
jgi:hypothetical protein